MVSSGRVSVREGNIEGLLTILREGRECLGNGKMESVGWGL